MNKIVKLNAVLDCIDNIVATLIKRDYGDRATGDARHTSADVSKVRSILGYDPKIDLETGLRQEWQWIQSIYSE